MSIWKPHNHLAGYIFERKHPKGHIVVYDAIAAGIDNGGDGPYVAVIEIPDTGHGNDSRIGPGFWNLPAARDFVRDELSGNNDYDWGF